MIPLALSRNINYQLVFMKSTYRLVTTLKKKANQQTQFMHKTLFL